MLVLAVLGIAAVGTLTWAAESLKKLGLTDQQAKSNVATALESGYVPLHPAAKAFKAADGATRATLARAALEWAKSYTESSEFRTAWERIRENHKPNEPSNEESVDQEMKRQREEQLQQIEDMKKSAAELPADQRKEFEKMVASTAADMEAMANDKEMQSMIRQGLEMQRASDKQAYEEALKKWQIEYPPDPRPVIAKRLRDFLKVSADVDFDATLVASSGKMKFANPAYEKKSGEWKLCYRTGKEPVEVARGFATEWLAELEKK